MSKEEIMDFFFKEEALATLLNSEFGEGINWTWKCPSHTSSLGKFKVSIWTTPEGARWKCWSCGAGFNAIDAVIQARGVSFKEALSVLSAEMGTPLTVQPRRSVEALTETPESTLNNLRLYASIAAERLVGDRLRDLQEERGWTRETIENLGIGYHKDEGFGVRAVYREPRADKETHPIRGTQRIRQGLLKLKKKMSAGELSEREWKVIRAVLSGERPYSIHENFLFSFICEFPMGDMELLTDEELKHWNRYLFVKDPRNTLLNDEEVKTLREVMEGKRRTVSAAGFNLRKRTPESFDQEKNPIEAYRQWSLSYEEKAGDAWVFPVYDRSGALVSIQLRRRNEGGQKYLNPSKGQVAPALVSHYLQSTNPDLVFITEGIPDAISVFDDGESAVALLGANAMKRTANADHLVKAFPTSQFVVVGDRDITGYKAAHTMKAMLEERGGAVSVFITPAIEGMEKPDFTDYLKHRKAAA